MMASLEPEILQKASRIKALGAFRLAADKIPAYREILKAKNLNPSSVKTIEDFKNLVPIISKEDTFHFYSEKIKKLCLSGEIKDAKVIVSSSGHSGYFSYGLSTDKELEKSQSLIDFMLNHIFDVGSKKTILINCLPMGVKITTSAVTVADTSVRSDIVLGVIRTFSDCYDQTILLGENSFIKKVLEEGVEQGIDWKKIKLNIILGEELIAENLRSYMADITGINLDDIRCQNMIGSSFGIAEFGLNLFYETKELIRVRRLIARDKALRTKLFGQNADNIPALFHYNPLRIFVEEAPKENGLSELVLTNLEKEALIPLIRYNIKDEGNKISFSDLAAALNSSGYEDYVPRIRLPIVAIWGRDKITTSEGTTLRPEFVKEILYQDRSIAYGITGNFKLSLAKAGLRIEIQAKKNMEQCPDLEKKIREIIIANIPAAAEIIVYPYRDFPHGMELNYEKKFQYI